MFWLPQSMLVEQIMKLNWEFNVLLPGFLISVCNHFLNLYYPLQACHLVYYIIYVFPITVGINAQKPTGTYSQKHTNVLSMYSYIYKVLLCILVQTLQAIMIKFSVYAREKYYRDFAHECLLLLLERKAYMYKH